jgi:hypothetical protein
MTPPARPRGGAAGHLPSSSLSYGCRPPLPSDLGRPIARPRPSTTQPWMPQPRRPRPSNRTQPHALNRNPGTTTSTPVVSMRGLDPTSIFSFMTFLSHRKIPVGNTPLVFFSPKIFKPKSDRGSARRWAGDVAASGRLEMVPADPWRVVRLPLLSPRGVPPSMALVGLWQPWEQLRFLGFLIQTLSARVSIYGPYGKISERADSGK